MSAQVTEAHRELAKTITGRTYSIEYWAQLIADGEAKACAELRAELDAQCLLNAKGSEREAVLLGRVDRMARECLNIRADLDAIKAIRDEEKARAERAEAEVERLRHLEALLNQAAAEVTAHTFTAGGIAGLRAELALLREWQREVIQNANAHHAERKDAIARAERAEAELAGIRALANRRNKRDHSQDTTHQLVAALDQALDIAQAELAAEREKVRVLKLDKDRLDWWNGEPYYQFGKSHKCMNPGWWWSCGFESGMHGKSGIKNIRDAIDSAMAHSKSGRNKYNVCKQIEQSSTEEIK